MIDRYNAAGGGLLASGIAFNTLFAFVPLALFASSLLGLFVGDPESLQSITDAIAEAVPPLAPIIDEVLSGLVASSAPLSLVGLIGTAWGATRLYASLERGIGAMFAGGPQRTFVAKTLRRVASIAVMGGLVIAAFAATSIWSIAAAMIPGFGGPGILLNLALFALPLLVSAMAVAIVYRVFPPASPDLRSVWLPAVLAGIGIVALTRVLAVAAPRVLGINFIAGTLGAIFVALVWLDFAYVIILVGAAWVRERMLGEEEAAAVAG